MEIDSNWDYGSNQNYDNDMPPISSLYRTAKASNFNHYDDLDTDDSDDDNDDDNNWDDSNN